MVWRSGRLLWGLLVVLVLSCRISLDLVKAQEDGEAIPGSCEGEEDQVGGCSWLGGLCVCWWICGVGRQVVDGMLP